MEDHDPTRSVLTNLLVRRHHKVTAAASLAEARELARGKDFDLLISDLGLPDGDGTELMEEMRKSREVKGIALSGYGTNEDLASSRKAGFVAHLVKPVTIQSLEKALAALQ